jgi:hypothetical protein
MSFLLFKEVVGFILADPSMSVAAHFLGLRVRIPPGARISLFSGRVLCVRQITRPEELYREWCIIVIVKPG